MLLALVTVNDLVELDVDILVADLLVVAVAVVVELVLFVGINDLPFTLDVLE